ncbi:hypothetical protein HK13_03180 [Acetobacter indonesiensis]|uniref:NAD(P)-binding protein n=1 Tax=Acetobacter indonesiensis TaxID=104101 RepID=UPI000A3BFE28|nr:FAD/NAD(P)-binding protein [Acetobacter indonesiensis]OUI95842.1 hypothetical protein HK13_03180 [Acetobacter indonesiensis]
MADSKRPETLETASITRRDFVGGVLLSAIAVASAEAHVASAAPSVINPSVLPPMRTGMRGSHPGAFEAAHALRDHVLHTKNIQDTGEVYDLVVVGGGLSGLAAAHFFRKYAGADKTVLIIENHDDFGGHAKRNQFSVDGHELVLNGGTLEIESPKRYNQWASMILSDIGIDLNAYKKENTKTEKTYENLGLKSGLFFDKETWGHDYLMPKRGVGQEQSWRFLSASALQKAPLSERAKNDLVRLIRHAQPDYMPALSIAEKKRKLASISYTDYLTQIAQIDASAVAIFQKSGSGVFCVGADALPALFAWIMGYPGFSGLGLGEIPEGLLSDLQGGQHGRQKDSEKTVHFPDGNATLARLLVSHLIPDATNARSQDDMGLADFNYTKLDQKGQPVRIRLSTLALNVSHDGPVDQAETVSVICAPAGNASPKQLSKVKGRQVVLACWNMIIPYMVPSLPKDQKDALGYAVKGPIAYVNVAIKNWQAFKQLGVSEILCPGMFFEEVQLAEPASLGKLKAPTDPSAPIVVRLIKTFGVPGLSKRDQHRAGRAILLGLTFEQFEQEVRQQLQRILGGGGFNADTDIAAITVNRWPHGYAYTYNSLYDPLDWVFTETSERPCVKARKPFGRVAIANSDSGASPHTDAAFEQAHRAVTELLARQTFPFVSATPGASTL